MNYSDKRKANSKMKPDECEVEELNQSLEIAFSSDQSGSVKQDIPGHLSCSAPPNKRPNLLAS